MKIIGVIPCRYGASRFPGKPLSDIHGKPMMWHVFQQARKAQGLHEVLIATDDKRIEDVCLQLALPVTMTSTRHPTGTDRVAEVATKTTGDIYVNVQGDEPMIDPRAIDIVTEAILTASPDTLASNGFNDIADPTNVIDTNVVKVVTSVSGAAMAYSRAPIPYPQGAAVQFRRQLGLYAFRRSGLEVFSKLAPGPVELAERVEMLRFLEHGYRVQMVRVPNDDAIPVDTPADLERIREMMRS
jgi:3-deoxy-manno-octulosonate cytidylyltransferase (CMP-KDO synthetase)